MKKLILYFFVWLIYTSCIAKNYKILKVYEGCNKYYTQAIYVETKSKEDSITLAHIAEDITGQYPHTGLTEKIIVFRNENENYAYADVFKLVEKGHLFKVYYFTVKFRNHKNDLVSSLDSKYKDYSIKEIYARTYCPVFIMENPQHQLLILGFFEKYNLLGPFPLRKESEKTYSFDQPKFIDLKTGYVPEKVKLTQNEFGDFILQTESYDCGGGIQEMFFKIKL